MSPGLTSRYFSLLQFSFLLLTVLQISFASDGKERDYVSQLSTTFIIDEDDGKYTLEEKTVEKHKFLTKRAAENREYTIAEHYYDSVTSISAELNGYGLNRGNISFEYPSVRDIFLSDYKIHKITFPGNLEVGDEISYTYYKDYNDIEFFPLIYITNYDSLSEYKIVIEHPKDISVNFKFYFPQSPLPYKIAREDDDEISLTFTNIRKSERLPYYAFNGLQAIVQVELTKGGKEINPVSLGSFYKWYTGLFNQAPSISATASSELDALVAKAASPREKVRIIHDYVRTNVRYIADEKAMNAIVPHDPESVLTKKFGDCKDKAYLVKSLAQKYGVNVHMVLISTNPRPLLNGTHVHQYNHVICMYEDGAKKIFFDPTAKYSEFGNLPEDDIEGDAFVLDPKQPQKYRVESPNQKPDALITISGDIDKPKEAKAQITLQNSYFSRALRAQQELSGTELENYLSNLMTGNFQKISLDYFKFSSQTDTSIIFSCDADLTGFIISSTAKKYIPHVPFKMLDADILEREQDTLSLYLDERKHIQLQIELKSPGFTAQTTNVAIGSSEPGKFTANLIGSSVDTLKLYYELNQSGKILEGERKKEFLDFCKDYLKSKKNMFILSQR